MNVRLRNKVCGFGSLSLTFMPPSSGLFLTVTTTGNRSSSSMYYRILTGNLFSQHPPWQSRCAGECLYFIILNINSPLIIKQFINFDTDRWGVPCTYSQSPKCRKNVETKTEKLWFSNNPWKVWISIKQMAFIFAIRYTYTQSPAVPGRRTPRRHRPRGSLDICIQFIYFKCKLLSFSYEKFIIFTSKSIIVKYKIHQF